MLNSILEDIKFKSDTESRKIITRNIRKYKSKETMDHPWIFPFYSSNVLHDLKSMMLILSNVSKETQEDTKKLCTWISFAFQWVLYKKPKIIFGINVGKIKSIILMNNIRKIKNIWNAKFRNVYDYDI
jgi:hypothetical protein